VVSLQQKNAIILAAGASKRLGQPKALVTIEGKSLIQILIKRLKKFGLNIIIVTRPDLEKEMQNIGEKVVINSRPEEGRTGSIQCGLKEIKGQNCLIVPVDRPGFSDTTLKLLLESEITACPSKNGKGGHPVILSRKDCEKVLLSKSSTPLRDLIDPRKIEVDDEFLHLNIDYPGDLKSLKNITLD
jgi:CTP:molybdopterin cytidylyltransferase MocA